MSRPSRPLTRADVMTTSEVAELTGIKAGTIAAWSREGRFPSRKRGRVRYHLRHEVEEWLLAPDC